jgi:aspartyl-tRNA(Asn)/glutamyl-tRNA(Gln) amidotransferase subunit A
LLPTLPITAPVLGEPSVEIDGTREPVRAAMLRLTQLFNITGHPAMAVPAGTTSDGWPISVQLVGHIAGTRRLIQVGAIVERYSTGGEDRLAVALDEHQAHLRPTDRPVAPAPSAMASG